MAMEDARGPLCVRRITGSGGGITYFFGHWQGCSRWSSPCCVSQHRSSYIYGRKKKSLSKPQSQWRACLRCLPYYISYPFLGEAWEPKGRATWCISLAIAVGMVLIATFCLPLYPFPQRIIPCVPHTKRVIEILYDTIPIDYEPDHRHRPHGLHLLDVEHRCY
jgi:hypothetical protein